MMARTGMEELIGRCQQGDREAMGRLYDAMHDELLEQCRKYVGSDGAAEDLLHDAFLLIFTNIGSLRSPQKGLQWMHKVVRNVCLLYLQQKKSHNTVSLGEMPLAERVSEPDAIAYDDLMIAIDRLPLGYRQVFRLSVLEGLTHGQIADLLGIEPHTSSSQLVRAKRQLRQMLRLLMAAVLAAVPLATHRFWPSQSSKHLVATTSAPVSPEAPTAPETPEVPAAPVSPVSPVAPVVPEAPAVPETPVAPEAPAVPEAPAAPETPVAPEVPAVPETPAAPEVPAVPEPPEAPKVPAAPAPLPVTASLAYSGLPSSPSRQLPFVHDVMDANGVIDSIVHHRLPVTIALNARFGLSQGWWLEGGLRYTMLSSETLVGNTYLYKEEQQRVRYLGLSLGVGRQLWQRRHWSLYSTASAMFELPLRSTSETIYRRNGQLIGTESLRLSPQVQWSVGAALGLQYNLTPSVGIFAEPSLQYYFPSADAIGTWRTDHTLTPALPFGIRIIFQ